MKRRIFSNVSQLFAAIAAVFLLALFTGCSKDDGKTLYLFNWTYYTPDSVIKQFEKEFGVKVKIDSYASTLPFLRRLLQKSRAVPRAMILSFLRRIMFRL